MKEKILIWIGISFGLSFVLFVILQIFRFGGFWIYDLERWESADDIEERFEGSFRPIVSFGGKSK